MRPRIPWGQEIRARIKDSYHTHKEVAQEAGRSKSWLSDVLRGRTVYEEAYLMVEEALERLLVRDLARASFEVLGQRLTLCLGERTRAELTELVPHSKLSVRRAFQGTCTQLEVYLSLGGVLGLPTHWTDTDWELPPRPEPLTERERREIGRELQRRIKAAGIQQKDFALSIDKSVSWLKGIYVGKYKSPEPYERAHRLLAQFERLNEPPVPKLMEHEARLLGATISRRLHANDLSALELSTSMGISSYEVCKMLEGKANSEALYEHALEHLEQLEGVLQGTDVVYGVEYVFDDNRGTDLHLGLFATRALAEEAKALWLSLNHWALPKNVSVYEQRIAQRVWGLARTAVECIGIISKPPTPVDEDEDIVSFFIETSTHTHRVITTDTSERSVGDQVIVVGELHDSVIHARKVMSATPTHLPQTP